jgi:uncharacterized protein (DUF302 family)/uncharacterized membrane protein YidH (DUF202 family)
MRGIAIAEGLRGPPMEAAQKPDLRDALAAERTFLAWIRTGLALMGFGFVVARFGLFLQQITFVQHVPPAPSYGLSLWFGTALIAVGVLVNLLSASHHVRLMRELNRGGPLPSRPSTQAVLLALFLALVGLAMAIYLVAVRGTTNLNFQNKEELSMKPPTEIKGIVEKPSNHSVDQTVDRLKNILHSKGVTLFALIDHSGEAEKVGLKMLRTKLLIFGNPRAGTPLMLAAPSSAIDLPLKILIWEDAPGKVWVSYNTPAYLQERHGLPPDLLQNIAMVETLAAQAAE